MNSYTYTYIYTGLYTHNHCVRHNVCIRTSYVLSMFFFVFSASAQKGKKNGTLLFETFLFHLNPPQLAPLRPKHTPFLPSDRSLLRSSPEKTYSLFSCPPPPPSSRFCSIHPTLALSIKKIPSTQHLFVGSIEGSIELDTPHQSFPARFREPR